MLFEINTKNLFLTFCPEYSTRVYSKWKLKEPAITILEYFFVVTRLEAWEIEFIEALKVSSFDMRRFLDCGGLYMQPIGIFFHQ